ncbi:MAG: antibiotic biosynthesis monooxygenase [Chloroflexi bacterium]|nr:antibiotic biosynthesis monooxygenase [Chloroflexota bacterium]
MPTKPIYWLFGIRLSPELPPEKEKEFVDWFNQVHIPAALESIPGLTGLALYETLNPEEGYPKYLCNLEFENEQALEAVARSPAWAASAEQRRRDGWGEDEVGFAMTWGVKHKPTAL